MSDIVIRAENLGKRYRIGERERYLALRDLLARAATAPARLFARRQPSSNGNSNHASGDNSHLWALRDVSLDIRRGEVLGIIGRNGAGKSTLLKILARVTKPTRGFAEICGRMGSLLEVGTGFHPELTGRENVFLSGAILGMSKSEIRRKFDEIVAFAEVEKFIDTPLKHYSSGMQMRLAFAVAAHLEPEILLVDEVLAVGDLQFQKKCLGKMGDVARAGRTILFVSHQMNQIRRLCTRAILVEGGRIRAEGSPKSVVNQHEVACLETCTRQENPSTSLTVSGWQFAEGNANMLDMDHPPGKITIRIRAMVYKPIRKGVYIIGLKDTNNVMVWSSIHDGLRLEPGPAVLFHEFKWLPLSPGIYTWEIRLLDGDVWLFFPLVPGMSITSKHDSAVWENFKGFLALESVFAMRQGESASQ